MIRHARAFITGVRDGFAQPFELSTTTNIDHLRVSQEWLDLGANLGQFLAASVHSQAWCEGYPIPFVRRLK